MRTLFVSADGILQPLGHSQIVRTVEGLSRAGLTYDILSLERADDLARELAVEQLEGQLAAAGVGWTRARYDTGGGAGAAARNTATLTREALRLAGGGRYGLIHARSFLGGVPARAARLAFGVPYLFDARAYWVEEKIEQGRWFTHPVTIRLARALERRLFADAAAVVTLTELQAEDARTGKLGRAGNRPIVCIPTCADYDEFTTERRLHYQHVPAETLARLKGRFVLGFIGSINRSYLMEESASLAARILRRRDDAVILATSPQVREYGELFSRHGIPADRTIIGRIDHWAMPEWLSLVDWGFLLVDPTPAKRASVPTKLAEFFASGVRPIHYGCNPEVAEWVRRAGLGLTLPSIDAAALEATAESIAASRPDPLARASARAITAPHFSLASGVARYDALLRRLGAAGRE